MEPVDVPQNIILNYYIDEIMLINQYKQEVVAHWRPLVRHMYSRQ